LSHSENYLRGSDCWRLAAKHSQADYPDKTSVDETEEACGDIVPGAGAQSSKK